MRLTQLSSQTRLALARLSGPNAMSQLTSQIEAALARLTGQTGQILSPLLSVIRSTVAQLMYLTACHTSTRSTSQLRLIVAFQFFLTLTPANSYADITKAKSDASEYVVVEQGTTKVLSIPLKGAIVLEKKGIIKLKDLGGSRIRIYAQKPGVVSLTSETAKTVVYVLDHSHWNLYQALQDEFKKQKGLKIEHDSDSPAIGGEFLRFKDFLNLQNQFKRHKAYFEIHAQIWPFIRTQFLDELKKFLSKEGLSPNAISESAPFTYQIGEESKKESKRTELAKRGGLKIEENEALIDLKPLVEVHILVAEVKRKFFQKLGIQWPDSYAAQVLPETKWDLTALSVNLQALEENGVGQLLASPKLRCRSGGEANFFAGGEIPIRVVGFRRQEVVWKKYGVNLKTSPRADTSGKMSIKLIAEISNLDLSQSVDGIPGLLTNRVESQFDLAGPRTIALSGLFRSDLGESTSGVPFLTKIPIIGKLFSSQDYRNNESELVFLVHPKVVGSDEHNF